LWVFFLILLLTAKKNKREIAMKLKSIINPGTVLTSIVVIPLIVGAWSIMCDVNEARAANKEAKWKAKMTGTIVDVDPLSIPGNSGLFFELKNTKGGHNWIWVWGDDRTGAWPTRGDVGTWYTRKIDDEDKYKWEEAKAVKKTITPAKVAPVISKSISWKLIILGVPPVNHTVLAKYKNGITITTAYLNAKGQWKLETERERISGGREIATIKEWKEIPR